MEGNKNNQDAKAAEDQKKVPTYEELVSTPISLDVARMRLAECDIQIAQCRKELAAIEQRIADITWVRQVILRQTLNPLPQPEAGDGGTPVMGQPVGGAEAK